MKKPQVMFEKTSSLQRNALTRQSNLHLGYYKRRPAKWYSWLNTRQ